VRPHAGSWSACAQLKTVRVSRIGSDARVADIQSYQWPVSKLASDMPTACSAGWPCDCEQADPAPGGQSRLCNLPLLHVPLALGLTSRSHCVQRNTGRS
jgi:hypothetical protein